MSTDRLANPEPASAEVGAQFKPAWIESGMSVHDIISKADREIATLKAELAKAKEDSELLDWLEANIIGTMGEARANEDEHPMHDWLFSAPAYEPEQGGLRQAIRSAIAASKEGK